MTNSNNTLLFGPPVDLEKTTEQDFEQYPMWEYIYRGDLLPGMYEWTVRPCINSSVFPEDGEMMLVTIDAILNNGTKCVGCSHLANDEPHLFQPSLCLGGTWFCVGTKDECNALAEAIGKNTDDVFPVRVTSRVHFENQDSFPSGELNAEGDIENQT